MGGKKRCESSMAIILNRNDPGLEYRLTLPVLVNSIRSGSIKVNSKAVCHWGMP